LASRRNQPRFSWPPCPRSLGSPHVQQVVTTDDDFDAEETLGVEGTLKLPAGGEGSDAADAFEASDGFEVAGGFAALARR
jgi:hypothetical protein